MSFKSIKPSEMDINAINTFGEGWPLLTAGTEGFFNTMTISWGHIGSLWGTGGTRPTVTVYVRPQRYTHEFMDTNEFFSLSVLPSDFKDALGYLGSTSGRDEDKVDTAGIRPVFAQGTTYFAEAKLVIICRKLYHAPILEEGFADRDVMDKVYPNKDFHTMYIGEIVDVLVRD